MVARQRIRRPRAACSRSGRWSRSNSPSTRFESTLCPGKVESEIDENTQARSGEEASEPVEYPEGKIPLTDGQAGTGDDIAEMVAFLASDRARFITGTPVWIDGGQSFLVG